MAALPVKTEINQESKYGSTQDSKGNIFAAQDVANLGRDDGEEGTLYVCGNCTAQLYFRPDSRLLCPNCSHITGASTVFYKIRTESTTYDTI
ncbi:RNA polymerase subunit putative (RPB) [Leptomonas pyrrhocoris]|uniref:RNA polymerase subunit putative (RPB) n=1 Tax=Leptomonas pyrrhocoris TaxID=157538 RepID=A0A0M9FSV0_LEPPY|nr:RNA polymerase subunit putative (RPB) [Leptomonas pyrrhocoris]XP_015653794.1 RNA polymerase subunit putative (RPB) [Leptomonas pyrrhocoris]XP_015653795.1 RNA polymerase subunit putative (RPB) [Leptomonas pyrrhocoris]KPA75354.1 RNA polymerase subunit putative (RPB) [Leptomonas pyrrhocoris]KPA75355.1 RNA polymerase subunit putative (RPB) [Leptomonas pyrrhocoris]KPA75356.1 RNA polymerase subunit putative (RPB) [Leptomonas pyrrhocoris]|eukprot:XP_015653793.1 RNA polymerase subunit putative (RPB) [Leptomonas pyrrhocoris]